MDKTALIILNYNNAKCTCECIKSVLKFNSAPIRIIVVDNNSSPEQTYTLMQSLSEISGGNIEILKKGEKSTKSDFTLVINDVNAGYAVGNNIGLDIAYADPDVEYVMILNNDILFVEDIIPGLINASTILPDCAILTPLLLKKDAFSVDFTCARRNPNVFDLIKQNFLHYWWKIIGSYQTEKLKKNFILKRKPSTNQPIAIELPSGSCMLMRKPLMKQIGSFDLHTFLYYEENILHKKIQRLGLRCYLIPHLNCIHLGSQTTSAIPDNLFMLKHNLASQKYYVFKYSGANWWTKCIYALSAVFFKFSFTLQKNLKKEK